MKYDIIQYPTSEPVTLAEAKAQARVEADDTHDDDYLESLIKAAREQAELHQDRTILTTQYKLKLDCWPIYLEFPKPRLQSVESVKYYDDLNVLQTLDSSNYIVDVGDPGGIYFPCTMSRPSLYRRPSSIEITATAGYTSAAEVPQSTKHGMLLLIAHWHRNREAVVTGTIAANLPFGVESLFAMDRWH